MPEKYSISNIKSNLSYTLFSFITLNCVNDEKNRIYIQIFVSHRPGRTHFGRSCPMRCPQITVATDICFDRSYANKDIRIEWRSFLFIVRFLRGLEHDHYLLPPSIIWHTQNVQGDHINILLYHSVHQGIYAMCSSFGCNR